MVVTRVKCIALQLNYISLLAERAGKPVPRSKIEGLSKDEASKVIDRLQAKLGISNGKKANRAAPGKAQVNDPLFGLSAKLVWQLMVATDRRPRNENFTAQVISLYQELSRIRQQLKRKLKARSK